MRNARNLSSVFLQPFEPRDEPLRVQDDVACQDGARRLAIAREPMLENAREQMVLQCILDRLRAARVILVCHCQFDECVDLAVQVRGKTLEILEETDALEAIRNYGLQLQAGLSEILTARDITHCFTGAPALMGLFFAETAPSNYREWINSNYAFYDTLAPELHNQGILVEPDSREPCHSATTGMRQDFSWEASARHYLELYASAIASLG